MGLETGVNYVNDLVSTNPTGTDPKGQGDDHLRNIKRAAKQTFPGFTGAIEVTGTDTGSANAYVLTPATPLLAYAAGLRVRFIATNANTGAATLNISGLGVKGLCGPTGNTLLANEITTLSVVDAIYDGSKFVLAAPTIEWIQQQSLSATLPSQSGNDGKALKTNGSSGLWDWDGFQGRVGKSADYTIALTDRYFLIEGSAQLTFTLPAASAVGTKFIVRLSNVHATAYITVAAAGSDTINSGSSIILAPGDVADVVATGSSSFGAVYVAQQVDGPHVIAEEQYTSGTNPASPTAGTYNTRVLNTLVRNTVGATLSLNQLTLPRGTWRLEARAPAAGNGGTSRTKIYNATDTANVALGMSLALSGTNSFTVVSEAIGVVTISSSKAFEVRQWISAASSVSLGQAASSGDNEVFTQLCATRISG